jgi:glycosyltransferase involved in cell wall biosynthesis
LSTVHPSSDPRIIYKIAPALARQYQVFCALPLAKRHPDVENVTTISLPYFQRLLPRLLFCHPVVLWKFFRIRPDLVHIFVPELLPVAFIFSLLGSRVIYEVQENLYKKFSIKKYNNAALYKQFFRLFDHAARRRFYCIFTEHAYLQEYRELKYPFALIRNYASVSFIDAHSGGRCVKNGPVRIFYSGVISMERCFDILVAALAKLKPRYPDFQVHLFGPVRLKKSEMKEIPGFTDVSENLVFYGYTDQKTALSYAPQCIAGIALLKPVADYPDSYTTKLFEYMALKLPVITSDFPIYKEVIDKSACGFCISPYDADALYNTLSLLIENPALRAEMGNNGRKSAEIDYNWIHEATRLMAFYGEILKTRTYQENFNTLLV